MKRPISAATASILAAIDSPDAVFVDPMSLDHLGINHLMPRLFKLSSAGFLDFEVRPTPKSSGRRWYRVTAYGRAALSEHRGEVAHTVAPAHLTCSGAGCGVALVCQRSAAGYSTAGSLPRQCSPGSMAHFLADMPTPSLDVPSEVMDWPVPIRVFKGPSEWSGIPVTTAPSSVWDLGFAAAAEAAS